MTDFAAWTRKWEEAIGEVLRRFRQSEIEPLRERVTALEKDLAHERRLAKLEARAGIGSVEPERRFDPA